MSGTEVTCGIIRCLCFLPSAPAAGASLLDGAERALAESGHIHLNAFSLYHGYPFHNHKVGILSDSLTHIVSLLTHNDYHPHDTHLTLERSVTSPDEPAPLASDIEVTVDLASGAGCRPDIWVKAWRDNRRVGSCRSVSARTYAGLDELETCGYTRWLGVDSSFRRQGIGRHLLQRALCEMARHGYTRAVLNCRANNPAARRLYEELGYAVADTVSAYVRDLGA